jgi:hypothetical protein
VPGPVDFDIVFRANLKKNQQRLNFNELTFCLCFDPHPPKLLGKMAEQEFGADIVLFDTQDPTSLINIVWIEFRPVLERVLAARPDLFQLSERRITRKADPDPLHRMLRIRFWQEYDVAQNGGRRMMQKDVTRGLCATEWWSRNINANPEMVAYIATPPPKYMMKMESMLDVALDNLMEIIELPIKDDKGKIDTRLISEKVKIFQMLDVRVKGAVVQKLAIHQKIDQRTQISGGMAHSDPMLDNMSLTDLEALDKSIASVKRQIERTQNRELLALPEPTTREADEPIVIEMPHQPNEAMELVE